MKRLSKMSLMAAALAAIMAITVPAESQAQRSRSEGGKVKVERSRGNTSTGKATPRTQTRKPATKSAPSRQAPQTGKATPRTQTRQPAARPAPSRSESGSSRAQTPPSTRSSEGSRQPTTRSAQGASRQPSARSASPDRTRVIRGDRSSVRIPARQGTTVKIPTRRISTRFRYDHDRRYRPYKVYHGGFVTSHPRIHTHIWWPWTIRYHRHWAPRYRYRQVVYVNVGWGRRHREARVEMETTYRHRVAYADDRKAVLEIEIEEIAIYQDGRYLGLVDRIPANLARLEATVYVNGEVEFDRDVFLVGDVREGFEMISTRYYNDHVLNSWDPRHEVRAGRVDLRNGRVRSVSRPRLFDPRNFDGFVPVSLLPEEEGWLWDFGADAISAVYDDYDAYYGADRGQSGYRSDAVISGGGSVDYTTTFGASVQLERESSIQRIE